MQTRPYDAAGDLDHVVRIWKEAGWINGSDADKEGIEAFYGGGTANVVPVEGDVEGVGLWTPSTYRWHDSDLSLCHVAAILVGRAGRRQGYATAVVNEVLAQAHEDGVALASLGAFEQGYYDRFGFANGGYEHFVRFDPATLTVPFPKRPPVRLDVDDALEFGEMMRHRHRGHGGVSLDAVTTLVGEFKWLDKPWGLGFRNAEGRLTHAVFGEVEGEYGPYRIDWIGYEEPEQYIELLGLLRSLSDQVRLLIMAEPGILQLQDLLRNPARQRSQMRMFGGQHQPHAAFAYHQFRMLDVAACLSVVSHDAEVEFDLELADPLADRGGRWSGVGGQYHVRVGPTTTVDHGRAGGGVPLVRTDVGALTSWWAGSHRSPGLRLMGRLDGPPEVLAALDDVFLAPPAHAGVIF